MRRPLARAWLAATVSLGTMACGEEQPGHVPTELYNPGDPCRSGNDVCLDDATALTCEDRVWTLTTCDASCAELGPAYLADGCDDGRCTCVLADPEACEPSDTFCSDDDTLEVCSPTQQWDQTSCTDLCAASNLEPLRCVPAVSQFEPAQCWCTAEGTPCDAEAGPSCVDNSTIGLCVDGVWVFEACAVLCGWPATCDPIDAACGC